MLIVLRLVRAIYKVQRNCRILIDNLNRREKVIFGSLCRNFIVRNICMRLCLLAAGFNSKHGIVHVYSVSVHVLVYKF